MFDSSRAKALVMSGTHRCAIAPYSHCTGSIGKAVRTNCQGRDEYQESDVAHSTKNTFWIVHVFLSKHIELVVSLHSTKQDAFIISDGTSSSVKPSSAVAQISISLAKSFGNILTCNDFEGSPTQRTLRDAEKDVCGATNVQGRHLNGAEDPCMIKVHEDGSPLTSSGRFVHIEQPVNLVKEVTDLVKGMERALGEYFRD